MYKIEFCVSEEKLLQNLVTQPNQAFSPRQIIEQFTRNEVIPCQFHDSDNVDTDHFTEDQLINDVIEFEDKIDAEVHLKDNQYELFKEQSGEGSSSESQINASQSSSEQGNQGSSEKA